eukprot:3964733-Pyramimonas_sp.AAC.1
MRASELLRGETSAPPDARRKKRLNGTSPTNSTSAVATPAAAIHSSKVRRTSGGCAAEGAPIAQRRGSGGRPQTASAAMSRGGRVAFAIARLARMRSTSERSCGCSSSTT